MTIMDLAKPFSHEEIKLCQNIQTNTNKESIKFVLLSDLKSEPCHTSNEKAFIPKSLYSESIEKLFQIAYGIYFLQSINIDSTTSEIVKEFNPNEEINPIIKTINSMDNALNDLIEIKNEITEYKKQVSSNLYDNESFKSKEQIRELITRKLISSSDGQVGIINKAQYILSKVDKDLFSEENQNNLNKFIECIKVINKTTSEIKQYHTRNFIKNKIEELDFSMRRLKLSYAKLEGKHQPKEIEIFSKIGEMLKTEKIGITNTDNFDIINKINEFSNENKATIAAIGLALSFFVAISYMFGSVLGSSITANISSFGTMATATLFSLLITININYQSPLVIVLSTALFSLSYLAALKNIQQNKLKAITNIVSSISKSILKFEFTEQKKQLDNLASKPSKKISMTIEKSIFGLVIVALFFSLLNSNYKILILSLVLSSPYVLLKIKIRNSFTKNKEKEAVNSNIEIDEVARESIEIAIIASLIFLFLGIVSNLISEPSTIAVKDKNGEIFCFHNAVRIAEANGQTVLLSKIDNEHSVFRTHSTDILSFSGNTTIPGQYKAACDRKDGTTIPPEENTGTDTDTDTDNKKIVNNIKVELPDSRPSEAFQMAIVQSEPIRHTLELPDDFKIRLDSHHTIKLESNIPDAIAVSVDLDNQFSRNLLSALKSEINVKRIDTCLAALKYDTNVYKQFIHNKRTRNFSEFISDCIAKFDAHALAIEQEICEQQCEGNCTEQSKFICKND